MSKQNYHHEYRFAPIFTEVLFTAVLPVAILAAFIIHPIYTVGVAVAWIGLLQLISHNMRIIGRKKLLKGEAQMFRNITFGDGSPLTGAVYGILFGIYQKPLYLKSEEGPIALIHGIPSYRQGFFDGDKAITTSEMADLYPTGQGYWLISCHNGYHGNFARAGQLFCRPISTMNKYPTYFDYDEKSKSAVVWAAEEVQTVELIALPVFLYVAPLVKILIKHFCPLEALLYNGAGNKTTQEINRLEDKWKKEMQDRFPF